MVNYCLPKDKVSDFMKAISDGRLDVFKLQDMSSADRRGTIADIIGDDHAKEVNALFESKMLLKYKFGLFDWVKQVTNIDDKTRQSIADKISKIDERILNPADQKSFLADLAAQKLGATVTQDEAKAIFDLTNQVNSFKDAWTKSLSVDISRKDYNKVIKPETVFETLRLKTPSARTTGDFDLDSSIHARNDYGNAILDLQDKMEELKPDGTTLINHILNAASMPKTLATGLLHFSAIGVQGWGMISKKVTWEAAYEQFRYFSSEENYRNLQAYIISHPKYENMVQDRLGLTDITDQLSMREEAIQSSYIQDANKYLADKSGLPLNVFGASSRAFTGFLNYTRANRYIDLHNAAESSLGREIEPGEQLGKDIASVVNNFTGRGNLDSTLVGANSKTPDNFGKTNQVWMNALFFAPRKIAATMQMFNPIEYGRLYNNARKSGNYTAANAAIGQLTGSILATGAVLYLAHSMGANVDYNPTSTEFLKIQLPGSDEKLDITGGNAIWTRFLARMILNKETGKSGKVIQLGEGYKPTTRADLAGQYIRGKLAPVTGSIADFMIGSDAVGRPFSISEELRSRAEPILLESLMNYYTQQPNKAISDIPVLSAMFGVNVESPTSLGQRQGVDVWGTPAHIWTDPARTQIDGELDKVGMTMRFPPKAISGVPLTDAQYKSYIVSYGSMAKARLSSLMQSESWQNFSSTQKQQQVKSIISSSQKITQAQIKIHSLGTDNDIISKSLKATLMKKGLSQ